MEDLNATVELDLSETIEGEFGTAVKIYYADGTIQEYSENNPEQKLKGMFRYYKLGVDPETGEGLIIHNPSILLRLSSMTQEIPDEDNAVMDITITSLSGSPVYQFAVESSRAKEGATDFGEVLFYLKKISQVSTD